MFRQYYDGKTARRKLSWVRSAGSALVRASGFNKGPYELQVTPLQAAALVLFNDRTGA